MRQDRRKSPIRRKKKKMREGITIIQRGNLSGEVTASKTNVARERSERAGTWPVIQQGWQTIPRRIKKKNMQQGISSSWKGTLSGEVTAGEMKMR